MGEKQAQQIYSKAKAHGTRASLLLYLNSLLDFLGGGTHTLVHLGSPYVLDVFQQRSHAIRLLCRLTSNNKQAAKTEHELESNSFLKRRVSVILRYLDGTLATDRCQVDGRKFARGRVILPLDTCIVGSIKTQMGSRIFFARLCTYKRKWFIVLSPRRPFEASHETRLVR